MISKDEMFKEEYYLNLQNTLDRFEKILFKEEYRPVKETKFYRRYEYISDDYSYKSIIETEIKNGYISRADNLMVDPENKRWPFLILTQTEADLNNDEIYISDNIGEDEFNELNSQEEIDKKVEEIDKDAQIEIEKHEKLPLIYIRHGFKKDDIGQKSISPTFILIDQFNCAGMGYDQPYKAYQIETILHSNIKLHELIRELNTGDLIRLYKAAFVKED